MEVCEMESVEVRAKRYRTILESTRTYGGHESGWRRWIREGRLGNAVVRLGRLLFIDSVVVDERLRRTGQLLLTVKERQRGEDSR